MTTPVAAIKNLSTTSFPKTKFLDFESKDVNRFNIETEDSPRTQISVINNFTE
jgi:hypothetical protein